MNKFLVFTFLSLLLVGVGCQTKQDVLVENQQKKIDELSQKVEQLQEKQETKTIVSQQVKTDHSFKPGVNDNVKNQLIYFEDLLESKMVSTYVNCDVLANYNNLANSGSMDSQTFKEAFPDSADFYRSECKEAYVSLLTNDALIAEPQLVNLRKLMSKFINESKALAVFALEGGTKASTIDMYHQKLKLLLTENREEILKIKREYDIK